MSSDSEERAAELRDLFFQSAQELLQALNEQGLALEQDASNRELVREIRRIVHTLKGDSAACGFRELSELAHELEDVLSPELSAAHAAALPEVVLSAADMFDAMCAAYRANVKPPGGDPLRALIWKMAQRPAATPLPEQLKPSFSWTEYERLAMTEAVRRGLRVCQIAVAFAPDCPMRVAGSEVLKKVLLEAGTLLAVSPEERLWPDATTLEFVLAGERDQQWLTNKCRIPGVVSQVVVQEFLPASDATGHFTEPIPDLATSPPSLHRLAARANSTVRVEADRIDNLLNLVGELVIGKSMLHQTLNEFTRRFPKDPLRAKFADAMAFQLQVLNSLQRSAMKIRMVPVDQLFRRFPRLVRDVARLCHKDVVLHLSGQHTELDKGLLDALAEPLMHLVRNAVDHGIETPAERRAAGKPEQGTLRLHACHEGNQVVIEIRDDGRGIDAAAVRANAVSRGLLTPEQAARMSETEAAELIFQPGFSTAGEITEISGRGVGLDVVKSALQKLKGAITVDTQAGRGTAFHLRLPLTLAIIRAMLFRVGERTHALPLEAVLEITRAPESAIHRVDNHEVLQLRDELVTLVRLDRLVPSQCGNGNVDKRVFIIVVGSGDRKFGLVVDKLVGEEELVIKPLDDAIVGSELVSGASILGDGTVVLILNLTEVVRKFAQIRIAPAATPHAGNGRSLEAMA